MQCRIHYTTISRRSACRPALKWGSWCLSTNGKHDFESIASAIARKNRNHGAIRIESNGLKKGYRHYTIRFSNGSWLEFAVETHR